MRQVKDHALVERIGDAIKDKALATPAVRTRADGKILVRGVWITPK